MGNIYSLFNKQQAAVTDSTYLLDVRGDPRSPTRLRRTPLAVLTSSMHKKAGAATDDPRSPTLAFRRTPLVKHDIDYRDPRSPMAGRTPIRHLRFDAQDPREPGLVRTPLASLENNVDPREPDVKRTPLASHVAHVPRRLADQMRADIEDDDDEDSMFSMQSLDEMDSAIEEDDEVDDDSSDGDFEEVDLDEASYIGTSVADAVKHEKLQDDWAARIMTSKATMRYTMLSPKQKRTPGLSLCADAVRGAIERAVQSARSTRHHAALSCETPISALMMRPEDACKAVPSTPPSPFIGRIVSSAPSSPAA